MNYPEYAQINGKKYKINTDFKTGIKCSTIANDDTIGEYERALAIIYKLFGDEGLNAVDDYDALLEAGLKFLSCNKEVEDSKEEPDMDFEEDYDYIEVSFMSDYHMDLSQNENMHWWKFNKLINGLSNSELGNCCILNKIRNIRKKDLREIDDKKERDEIRELQKRFALKKQKKEEKLTSEQLRSIQELDKMLGL